ncbi:serine/threonine-protein kinase-like protein At5g23170 [Coffea arabica]|uniref:Serine/threonine-protein kinase-like protein At5g23170 n=1 Tax=Coffea arabica TaxID=13443 RepID=A0ABM4WVW7_COFAR
MHEFKYEELVQATENFSQSRLVGKGSHGHVYRGILKRNGCQHDQLVAVKKQSLGLQKLRDNSKLENEVHILSSLSHNPYVINLLGISHDSSNNKVLVMEYMPNGTLHEMLRSPVGASSCPPPTWPKRAQIALQIAKAVQFLHEARPPIVHRDIKSANILFDSDWNARLADLGLAIRMNHDSLNRQIDSLNRPAGTIGYLDPAYTVPSKLSTKIDVFSFGVLLLEIISARKVMDVSRSPSSIVEWAIPLIQKDQIVEISDRRVPISRFTEGLIRNMLSIAGRCINFRETDRPSMGEIVSELENCIVEPIRFPVWMNLLRSLIQRKIGTSKSKTAARAATSIVCAPHQENGHADISRGKLLLREILADIS